VEATAVALAAALGSVAAAGAWGAGAGGETGTGGADAIAGEVGAAALAPLVAAVGVVLAVSGDRPAVRQTTMASARHAAATAIFKTGLRGSRPGMAAGGRDSSATWSCGLSRAPSRGAGSRAGAGGGASARAPAGGGAAGAVPTADDATGGSPGIDGRAPPRIGVLPST